MAVQPDTSREPFERFLIWLSPNRELALKKYDEIMRKTSKYFAHKSCPDSEELAGETRDRVIKIINAGVDYSNPAALFFSVASKIWMEYARRPRSEPLPEDELLLDRQQEAEVKERQAYCLQKCLAQLPESERDLILRYYQGQGLHNIEARKLLIAEHGGANVLRIKAFRIRMKLRACMGACIHEGAR
jgi:DNA-directed RNA polymerase specialized sigma24 family protein